MVKIDNFGVRSTGWKHKDRLHLRLATEVHWSGRERNRAESWRLHAVLSVLPIIPNIRILSLRNADINGAQQAIIFGLSTLRRLVVQSCQFSLSRRALPSSHVAALKLANNDFQTTYRLLLISSPTLESLEVGYFDGTVGSILRGGLIALPKLSTFTMENHGRGTTPAILDTLKQYTSITTLHVIVHRDPPYPIPADLSSLLPALRSLTCNPHLAVKLILKRPVKTYVEIAFSDEVGFWRLVYKLSKARTGITDLKLFVPDFFRTILPSLAITFQRLEQLTLKVYSRSSYPYIPSPLHNSHGAATVVFPKLKGVAIWVDDHVYTYFTPEWLLKECFVPACPALEAFEWLHVTLFSPIFNFNWLPEPRQEWKAWKLPDGSWERQGPPPIPVAIPAKTLHAEP